MPTTPAGPTDAQAPYPAEPPSPPGAPGDVLAAAQAALGELAELAAAQAALGELAELAAAQAAALWTRPDADTAERLLVRFDDTVGAARFWLEHLAGRWG